MTPHDTSIHALLADLPASDIEALHKLIVVINQHPDDLPSISQEGFDSVLDVLWRLFNLLRQ